MKAHRLASTVLLAAGVMFVFAGLSQALGYSIAGFLASAAAIAALLYAGGVWFGAAPSRETPSVMGTKSTDRTNEATKATEVNEISLT